MELESNLPPACALNHASVLGMLLCLTGHSHPELSFAVSQAARFMFCPKRSHELALIRIGQHLKDDLDEGLIMRPVKMHRMEMDCHVDADS